MNTVIIRGSHGNLTVDRVTGNVLHLEPDAGSTEYADIVRFDPATLPDASEGDILGTGFWDAKNHYEPAMIWSDAEECWVDQPTQ